MERHKSNVNRHQVEIHSLVKGERYLECLATVHESELSSLQDILQVARITALNNEENQHS